MSEIIPIGKEASKLRRSRISELYLVVRGNRGWRDSFYERYPHFNSAEGAKLLDRASRGQSDDAELLKCLEDFIPWVQTTLPDWYVKQFQPSMTEE